MKRVRLRWSVVCAIGCAFASAGVVMAQERMRTVVTPDTPRRIIVEEVQDDFINASPGTEVSLDIPIRFAHDSARLGQRERHMLDEVAYALNDRGLRRRALLIEGHTDAYGKRSYNDQLSQRRAQAVAHHLIRRGVSRGRLRVIGYGESRPLPRLDRYDGRNRRVEILFLDR